MRKVEEGHKNRVKSIKPYGKFIEHAYIKYCITEISHGIFFLVACE